MTSETRTQQAPIVWLLTDNKPGHRNQLKGLGNRLRALAGVRTLEIDAATLAVPVWRALLGVPPAMDPTLPPPDLVIAAGSETHRLLLSLRRRKGVRTAVLMKPGFPLGWVNAAIIPLHDNVAPGKRVLLTEGALNNITPLARLTDKPEALVLVGGPSPHFDWDNDVVQGQITQLMSSYREWRWTISSSRRTPEALVERLRELAGPKVTVVTPEDTHEDWLSHRLAASRAVWVTPDSISMVCEAATSGVPTGIFELAPRKESQVANGIRQLLEQNRITSWRDHAAVMSRQSLEQTPFWEADRAARWLISRFLQGDRR